MPAPTVVPSAISTPIAISAPPPPAISAISASAPPAAPPARPVVRPKAADDGRGDVALVRSAYQALRAGDATRSLALLDEHARRFPASALAEERDATRVLALCDLGRRDQARAAYDRYARTYPLGVQLKALPSSCAP
jgi:hypothetical protein